MKQKRLLRWILAICGIGILGLGVGINAAAFLGNDPVAILYDGLRNAVGLSFEHLGMITNCVNVAVIILMLFIGRKYLHVGTVLYMVLLGTFVNLGGLLYEAVLPENVLYVRLIAALIGSLFVFAGVALFIVSDIGLDPFTGLVLLLQEKLKWEYRKTKVCFDIILVVIGTVLGGKLGVITILTALTAGPCIQWMTAKFSKLCKKDW